MKIPVEQFERSLKYIDETGKILKLSIEGIIRVSIIVDVTKKLVEVGEIDIETIEKQKPAIEFAKEQVRKGFPLLFAHSLVAIWGSLESMVIDFIVSLINENPNLLENDIFKKIKIPLAEFQVLDKDDRLYFLIRETERSLKLDFKPGIERFEAFFNSLKIGGAVDKNIKKTLFELYHMRNLILHRSSIIDQKFLTACPWRKEEKGDVLQLGIDDFLKYRDAVVKYIILIRERLVDNKFKKKDQ